MRHANSTTISLVIPAYNEEAYIGACIEAATVSAEGRFLEIIVVDNASTDRTGSIAASYQGVRVVREERKGTGPARARGLAEARGELVAYIDADTLMPRGWVEKGLESFLEPRVVCLSGPYEYYDASWGARVFMKIAWFFVYLGALISGSVVIGGNFIARRDALLAMGGIDDSITFYGDDTDIARRISRLGKVCFRRDFSMPTSHRRYAAQGLVRTNLIYFQNFISELLFGKPYTLTHEDFRPPQKKD